MLYRILIHAHNAFDYSHLQPLLSSPLKCPSPLQIPFPTSLYFVLVCFMDNCSTRAIHVFFKGHLTQ